MIFLSLLVGYMIVPWWVFLASGGWVEEEFCKAGKSGFSCCHVELDLCENASSAEPIWKKQHEARLSSAPTWRVFCGSWVVIFYKEILGKMVGNFCNYIDVLWLPWPFMKHEASSWSPSSSPTFIQFVNGRVTGGCLVHVSAMRTTWW